jgi:hypothetical protein
MMTDPDKAHYPETKRLAYADPPYPSQAKRWYGDQPDFAGEIDHRDLISRLCLGDYDGWALSTSAAALRDVLALCPPDVRVAIWHIPDAEPPGNRGRLWWSWEPVIICGGRIKYGDGPVVRDLLTCFKVNSQAKAKQIAGQKPPTFCRWVLDLLGYRPGDTVDDLYPGSGAMGRVLAQGRLDV